MQNRYLRFMHNFFFCTLATTRSAILSYQIFLATFVTDDFAAPKFVPSPTRKALGLLFVNCKPRKASQKSLVAGSFADCRGIMSLCILEALGTFSILWEIWSISWKDSPTFDRSRTKQNFFFVCCNVFGTLVSEAILFMTGLLSEIRIGHSQSQSLLFHTSLLRLQCGKSQPASSSFGWRCPRWITGF